MTQKYQDSSSQVAETTLRNIVTEISAYIHQNNPDFTNSLLNAVGAKEMTLMDAYIYASRKLYRAKSTDENAAACKRRVLQIKLDLIEAIMVEAGTDSRDCLLQILTQDTYELMYSNTKKQNKAKQPIIFTSPPYFQKRLAARQASK